MKKLYTKQLFKCILAFSVFLTVGCFLFGNSKSQEVDLQQNQGDAPSTQTPAPPTTSQVTATTTFTSSPMPTIKATSTMVPTLTLTPTPLLDIGSTMIRDKDSMEMVYVPAGEFTMGSYEGWLDDEKPEIEVYLDPYWIDKYEVTNAQYAQCVADGTCSQPSSIESYARDHYYGNPTYDNYPVVYVNWTQADAYCAWAGGRLPTEAEWEKAARGTDAREYPWGDATPICNLVNFGGPLGCVGDTSAVGSYPAGASPYGAMDLAGNVWEWVADWYDSGYYSKSPLQNPTGPASGSTRVLRGGSWGDHAELGVRSALRLEGRPNVGWYVSGFRCVSPP